MAIVSNTLEEVAHMIAGNVGQRMNQDAIEEIKRHVVAERARFVKLALENDRGSAMKQALTVTLNVVLERTSTFSSGNDINCNTDKSPVCPYVVSKELMPKPLEITGIPYLSVTTYAFIPLANRSREDANVLNNSYFGKPKMSYELMDSRLHVYNNPLIENILVKMIPADVRELDAFNSSNCLQCSSQNDLYIPEYLIPDIINSVTRRMSGGGNEDYEVTIDGK